MSAELSVQGVSTRTVKAITEELCGYTCSASTISRNSTSLDGRLRRFAERKLDEASPYLVLNARYEKVRLNGVIQTQAVWWRLGSPGTGGAKCVAWNCRTGRHGRAGQASSPVCRRTGRTVSHASPPTTTPGSRTRWPSGCRRACGSPVHCLRNALDSLPRTADDDYRREYHWRSDRRDRKEAPQDLQTWIERWAQRYPQLTDWVEAQIGETLNFYRLPRQHHTHLKSTNLLERLNEEIKRRTRVVRIFPNPASCLRLIRALGAEKDLLQAAA